MIREKKAQTQRVRNTHDAVDKTSGRETTLSAHPGTQSSPLGATNLRGRPALGSRRASGANGKPAVQKEMGLREMSEHISKVDKQNFDLKLEVFHRRQRNEVLEARVEELEAQEADYEILQSKYEALLLESDKQRLILEDAVVQICDLQSENEELQVMLGEHFAGLSGSEPVNTSKGAGNSDHARSPPPLELPQDVGSSTRPQISDRQSSVKRLRSTTSRRNLDFNPTAREGVTKAAGLHSFYATGDGQEPRNPSLLSVNRPGSVFSGDDEDVSERQMLNSPRLSILSESGFSSIYGNMDSNDLASTLANIDKADRTSASPTGSDPSKRSAHRNARIDLWIEEKPKTPLPSAEIPRNGVRDHYASIEQVLQKPSNMTNDHAKMPDDIHIPQRQSSSTVTSHESQRLRERRHCAKLPLQRGRSFSSSNGSVAIGGKFPPTPDTMSTATIGGKNSSTQSIITEKSLADHSQPLGQAYANLVAYARPGTSESDSPRSEGITHRGLKGLGFDDEIGVERLQDDDEVRSTVVEHGDRDIYAVHPYGDSMTHRNPDREVTSKLRPSMTTRQTDMFFNGEGFALVQPSRTFSYPASGRRSNPPSAPLSPQSHKSERSQASSKRSDRVAQPRAPNKIPDINNVTTPTKSPPKHMKSTPPARHMIDDMSPLSKIANQNVLGPAAVVQPKSGRFAFFKRSSSQNADTTLDSQTNPKPRSHVHRSTTPTPTRSQVPEQDFPFGETSHRIETDSIIGTDMVNAGTRPGTSDGSAPSTFARASQNTRRHSAIVDRATSFIPKGKASFLSPSGRNIH